MTVRNTFVRGALLHPGSVLALLCRSEITVETAATKLDPLSAMRIFGSLCQRPPSGPPNCQRQGAHGYQKDNGIKAIISIVLF